MNETDLTLNYTLPVGPVSLTGGFIHYDFDGGDTQEIYLTGALAMLLNPSLSLYYDIDEGEGGFAVLAVSQAFPVGPISLTAGGSVGFNLGDKAMGLNADGEDFTGLYYGEVSLATSIPVFANVTIDPRIAYSTALGSDGEDAITAISGTRRQEGHVLRQRRDHGGVLAPAAAGSRPEARRPLWHTGPADGGGIHVESFRGRAGADQPDRR